MTINLDKLWYGDHPLRWFLWPLALIYSGLSWVRRNYLLRWAQQQFPVPIIVVGNLTVGGVGKTPLVIALAKQMQIKGLQVGIVSRGYGANINQFPHEITATDDARDVGDEPVLIARKTGCPVVIAPKRVDAVRYLLAKHPCQIIISDDGLQHYAMGRAIEIAVIDGMRKLGNRLRLPAGPLREGARRLQQVDFIVVNEGEWPDAHTMRFIPGNLTNMLTGQEMSIKKVTTPVAAVAGIGNPQRFFTSLQNLGISFKKYPFPDHHNFQLNELQFKEKMVVMTEKDAVRCRSFTAASWYFLPIEATLSDSFWQALWSHKHLQGYKLT